MSEVFKIFIFLLACTFHQVYLAKVEFKFKLSGTNLALNCSYSLGKDEVLYKVLLKKDAETFIKFDDKNKKEPEFIKVKGISDVTMQGGGQVTIKNFDETTTLGIYSCNIFYDPKATGKANKNSKVDKGTKTVSKKYNLSLPDQVCDKPVWRDGRKIEETGLPPGTYIAGTNNKQEQMIYCRTRYQDTTTPGYYVKGKGCVFTFNGYQETQTFDVLVGSGFTFQSFSGNNKDVPTNSYEAGGDGTGKLYLGICTINGDQVLSKVGDNIYAAYNGNQENNCNPHKILLCKGK